LADGVEKVCLAEAGACVDEEGVVVASGLLCDGLGCSMCEAVGLPDDEVLERVPGNEVGRDGEAAVAGRCRVERRLEGGRFIDWYRNRWCRGDLDRYRTVRPTRRPLSR